MNVSFYCNGSRQPNCNDPFPSVKLLPDFKDSGKVLNVNYFTGKLSYNKCKGFQRMQ